ncbi:hypothetical protein K3N28_12795 [Glycomyces sp. TRM65418]|uniref:hypothetical protein n=1 Tax=Glycomyces sp. TRM65418 TaxID=2867006 RepID=UPI001CE4F2A3|nr:hypothetical protein [Glycomyces sp. TRM65418]MCC3763943.1 hypothetical protein [Glycomyces sp. TRM65418]QZD53643.1 hypothetical protein K3N28_12725 [Glycomyces sp. TRM65418]
MNHPPPPAAPPPPIPTPETMPGTTKAAVVLLWILFGFGICGGIGALVGYAGLSTLESQGDVEIPSSFMPYLVASIVQLLIWTVLRGVFAVKIAKRSASARKGAVILELVGVALGILAWILTPEVEVVGADAATNTASSLISTIIGIALAGIVIGLLSTQDTKRWCDR